MATLFVKEEVIRVRMNKKLKDRLKNIFKVKKISMIYMVENIEAKTRNRR
ncbi:hypothetical protein NSA50_14385 [Clostridium sp. DSM 100503]|nr:hypothetical protein [Clostridium sp. DSM 100503]MCR1952221.1 hypothetical protein [Clostridium sp. DSM 100503]